MQAVKTRNSSSDVMYFAYPGDETNCPKSVTRDLSLAAVKRLRIVSSQICLFQVSLSAGVDPWRAGG